MEGAIALPPNLNTIYTDELSYRLILLLSWEIFKSRFFTLLLTYIGISLSLKLLSVAFTYLPGDSFYQIALGFVGLSLYAAGFYKIVETSVKSEPSPDFLSLLRFMKEKLAKITFTIIIAYIIIGMLSILLIIPGLIWAVYYIFAVNVVADKGLSGKEALYYSKNLVSGRWWEVVGFFIVLNLIVLPFLFPLLSLNMFVTPQNAIITLLWKTGILVGQGMLLTFMHVAYIVMYVNLDNAKKDRVYTF